MGCSALTTGALITSYAPTTRPLGVKPSLRKIPGLVPSRNAIDPLTRLESEGEGLRLQLVQLTPTIKGGLCLIQNVKSLELMKLHKYLRTIIHDTVKQMYSYCTKGILCGQQALVALMDNDEPVDLPFEVGQMTESRSFMKGFRGAWFQCKIKEIGLRKGQMGHQLEYVDFPDERVKWAQLYQKPNKSKEKKQLMVRPQFPRIYRESQTPDVSTILEVAVIVVDSWQVGNLVDWWTDGCYWSGRVVELLGNDKVKVELFPPPMGEGLSYEALCKDLRPSLDWTPECGWTVPIPSENGNVHSCARIIKSFNQEAPGNLMAHDKGRKGVQAAARASLERNTSSSSHISGSLSQPSDGFERMAKRPWSTTASKDTRTSETNFELDMVDTGIGKTSGSDSVSSTHVRDAPTDTVGTAAGKGKNNDAGSSKKMKHGSISLNSMCSDTVEAAVMDLDELLNKIKWARAILEFGKPLSGTTQNPWKFLEHRPSSSTPK